MSRLERQGTVATGEPVSNYGISEICPRCILNGYLMQIVIETDKAIWEMAFLLGVLHILLAKRMYNP